jgi:hypothetical protein
MSQAISPTQKPHTLLLQFISKHQDLSNELKLFLLAAFQKLNENSVKQFKLEGSRVTVKLHHHFGIQTSNPKSVVSFGELFILTVKRSDGKPSFTLEGVTTYVYISRVLNSFEDTKLLQVMYDEEKHPNQLYMKGSAKGIEGDEYKDAAAIIENWENSTPLLNEKEIKEAKKETKK